MLVTAWRVIISILVIGTILYLWPGMQFSEWGAEKAVRTPYSPASPVGVYNNQWETDRGLRDLERLVDWKLQQQRNEMEQNQEMWNR